MVDSWGNTSYYSSSKITTKGNFSFRYGKVEVRIKKLLMVKGFDRALDKAQQVVTGNGDGEIDIMEQWGNNYLTNNTTGELILVIVRIVNQLILMKIFLHIFQMVLTLMNFINIQLSGVKIQLNGS